MRVFEFKEKCCLFNQKRCRMIIIREITEVSRVEYARSLEKISDIMIASTSHDMRTPLNTIVNMIRLIKLRCTD
jgi:K+-sensing histidine kinase KdpD